MGLCCWLNFSTVSTGSVFLAALAFLIFNWISRIQKAGGSLAGQHVVITGGSSGIGKELAKKAVARGANVTILARNVPKLEEACKEIRNGLNTSSQNVTFFKADVVNYEDIESVINRCEIEVGPVDILINSAGYAYPAKLEDIPLSHIKGMMDINYLGTAYAVRSVLPSMKSRRKGKIICISSIGGLIGLYGYTAYAASKFALRGFAEALQMEVKPYGISVTLGFPPDTETPGLAEENRIKPTETKLISDSAGVYAPDKVAENILSDALVGDFFSSTGFDGNLSTVICAGMSPMSSLFGLIMQVFFGGILRIVSLGYLHHFNRIVSKCAWDKEKQKKAE